MHFGSWEVELEKDPSNIKGEFLSILSRFSNPHPYSFIPFEGLCDSLPRNLKPLNLNPSLSTNLFEKGTKEGSHSSDISKYNFRPHTNVNGTFKGRYEGALGNLEEEDPNSWKRGRKYYLSIAQKQANLKVKSGRQQYFNRDL
jgi:hypothetical protein